MDLETFNRLDPAAAADVVRPCAAVASWVDALVAGRPYAGRAELLRTADLLARAWTGTEVEGALADHPRIGERHRGTGVSASLSADEQAGVDPRDADVAARLERGNRDYQARFGRIFLVRAAGRSAEQILGLLEQRLGNDTETELAVTAVQLREIALLRLEGVIA